jgi:hypothetical protein
MLGTAHDQTDHTRIRSVTDQDPSSLNGRSGGTGMSPHGARPLSAVNEFKIFASYGKRAGFQSCLPHVLTETLGTPHNAVILAYSTDKYGGGNGIACCCNTRVVFADGAGARRMRRKLRKLHGCLCQ